MQCGYQETFPFSEPNTPLASGDDIKQQRNLQAGKLLPGRCKINLAKTQQAVVTPPGMESHLGRPPCLRLLQLSSTELKWLR